MLKHKKITFIFFCLGIFPRCVCRTRRLSQYRRNMAHKLLSVRQHQILVLQNHNSHSRHSDRGALWDVFRLPKFWLHLVHHALSKGIYYRVTVSRKDFRALPEDLFRSFLRIRGKDIWWDQNFLANRVRVAKSDKSEKAVTGWNIFFNKSYESPTCSILWVSISSERGQFYSYELASLSWLWSALIFPSKLVLSHTSVTWIVFPVINFLHNVILDPRDLDLRISLVQ